MTTPPILQPGVGPIRGAHYLRAKPATVLWGRLPCAADAPVLTVDPGTEVTIDTISHEGVLEDQGRDPVAFFARSGVPREQVLDDAVELAASGPVRDPEVDGPHVVTGPIAVRGAEPGDLLAITVVETLPRVPYGVISNRHGRGALPGEYPLVEGTVSVFAEARFAAMAGDGASAAGETGTGHLPLREGGARVVEFPLAPFPGILGVAAAGDERPHSVPPGRFGGNLDIRLMTAGSVVYLPVQVAGALAYVGDPHFAQGDGEVALTALEASLRVTLRFDVVPEAEALARFGEAARHPLVETEEWIVPTGLDEDLDVAVQQAVRGGIAVLEASYGMDRAHAYAYLSAAADVDVSQVVDLVKGAHLRIRKADFDGVRP